jgi:hypothetical protein
LRIALTTKTVKTVDDRVSGGGTSLKRGVNETKDFRLKEEPTVAVRGRWRRVVVVLVVCVLTGIGVVAFWPGEKEPQYNGKTLTEWLTYRWKAQTDQEAWEAQDAVRHIGTNALPWLVKWMSYQPPAWKQKMSHWKILQVVPEPLLYRFFRQEFQRYWLWDAFITLAPKCNEVFPELIRVVDRWPDSPWERALGTLSSLGTNGLVALHDIATNGTRVADVRCGAMGEIGSMFNQSRHRTPAELDLYKNLVVPDLMRCLDEPEIAWGAARALGNAQLAPEVVVPALTNAMRFNDMLTRVIVAETLGRFREQARAAIPVLVPVLNDSDDRIRLAATNALMRIAPEVLTNGVRDF